MNAQDLEKLLRLHEDFLKGRPGGERMDMTEAKLQGLDLSKRDLAGATFDGNLVDVSFRDAILDQGIFRKVRLRRCDFGGARLRGVNLRRASLESCSFRNADLRDADFTRTTARDLDLRGAELSGAIFYQTVIVGAKVNGSKGFWARQEDGRFEMLDFSIAGDGSDMRSVDAWVDPVYGLTRPIRIRLKLQVGSSPISRVEPNAREREVDLGHLPVSAELREALRQWADRYDEAIVETDPLPSGVAQVLEMEGRSLQARLQAELPAYDVSYEP